jgi:hypothetical protein
MINFEHPTDENPFGKITVVIDSYDRSLFQPPFTFQVVNDIDGEVKWESSGMLDGWWSTFVEPCNSEAIVRDAKGLIAYSWKWNTDNHGDRSHKVFLEWCKRNKSSKGISIGTHNGTTGEWVVPVMDGLIEAFLVEASDKQYNELFNNYKNVSNAHTIQSLITADGLDIEFFESDDGFTNSTSKEHVLKFHENVRSVFKKSISLNDLIIQCGLKNDLKWLHLDVEGIDDELVMSLDDTKVKLPEIIIYESLNFNEERKERVIKYLESKNYQCEESGWNTIAILKKTNDLDLSLLIHTCDDYEQYWGGMFYTLDSYWDYDYIPVYFANEQKKISDIVIDCKGTPYKPDSRINQILTTKTDKNGFSTRFIYSMCQVPTKYVLYMQEDMWLKRSLDKDLLNDIIKFMDEVNADSVKIHAKLFYYDNYKLEPTDYFIKNQRFLKYLDCDALLTHNATIWRKDYILENQIPGEDPWTNEISGSRRMSSKEHNHYHYNIHWYCQPGIADKGEPSQEFVVYAHIVDEMKSMELKLNLKK